MPAPTDEVPGSQDGNTLEPLTRESFDAKVAQNRERLGSGG